MAQKRMFDIEIINQDSFYDLPMEAKALYFLLGMEADDEGFIAPRKILRLYGGTDDSIKILITKGYLIPFQSGVVVITDWKRNNYLDKKRIKETIYQDEKKQLQYDEQKQKYVASVDITMLNNRETNVKQSLRENRIEEYSIEENRIEQNRIEQSSIEIKEKSDKGKKYGEYKNVVLTDAQLEKLKVEFNNWQEWIDKLDCYIQSSGKKYKDCLATIRNWARKEKQEVKGKKTKRITGTEHDWGNMNQYYDN